MEHQWRKGNSWCRKAVNTGDATMSSIPFCMQRKFTYKKLRFYCIMQEENAILQKIEEIKNAILQKNHRIKNAILQKIEK